MRNFGNVVSELDKKVNEKGYEIVLVKNINDLKLDDIKDGISLQLITYLDSFIENVNKIERESEI